MGAAHQWLTGKIGNRARHAQHTVIAPRSQAKAFSSLQQQRAPLAVWRGHLFQQLAFCVRILAQSGVAIIARRLNFPCDGNTLRHLARALTAGGLIEIGKRNRRNIHPQIKPVHQRARDAAHVVLRALRCPRAGPARIAQRAAFAGVRRRNQHEPAGIADMGIGSRHIDGSGLQRLTQGFQNRAAEFRQFIKKQHAIMGEADLTGLRAPAASDDCGHRRRVMGRAKRSTATDAAAVDQAAQ